MKIIEILKLLFGIKRPSNVYSDVMRGYDLDAVKRFTELAQLNKQKKHLKSTLIP